MQMIRRDTSDLLQFVKVACLHLIACHATPLLMQFVEPSQEGDDTFILTATIKKGNGTNERVATTSNLVQILPADVVRGEGNCACCRHRWVVIAALLHAVCKLLVRSDGITPLCLSSRAAGTFLLSTCPVHSHLQKFVSARIIQDCGESGCASLTLSSDDVSAC